MTTYWKEKKITKVLKDIEFLKKENNDLNFYIFYDYLFVLKLILKFKISIHIPTELIIKIIETKYNLELSENEIFNEYNLYLSMIQLIFNKKNFANICKFSFYNQEFFTKVKNEFNYKSFNDIAHLPIGMGYVIILSLDKKYKKYFLRFAGGSSGHEVQFNHKKFENLKIEKYLHKLMKFEDILTLLISKKDIHPDEFNNLGNLNNIIRF